MRKPMSVSTLSEAAEWMTSATDVQMSERDILDCAFRHMLTATIAFHEDDSEEPAPIDLLYVALPPDIRFMARTFPVYEPDEMGVIVTPPWTPDAWPSWNDANWQLIPLTYRDALSLLESGVIARDLTKADLGDGVTELRIKTAESLPPITMEMVRIRGYELGVLLQAWRAGQFETPNESTNTEPVLAPRQTSGTVSHRSTADQDNVPALPWNQTDSSFERASEISENRPHEKPAIQKGAVHKLKQRGNILDPVIDKAISKAGCNDANAVFLSLRELALNEEPPFTGIIDADGLCYTNAKGKPDQLSIEALKARLRRRKKQDD